MGIRRVKKKGGPSQMSIASRRLCASLSNQFRRLQVKIEHQRPSSRSTFFLTSRLNHLFDLSRSTTVAQDDAVTTIGPGRQQPQHPTLPDTDSASRQIGRSGRQTASGQIGLIIRQHLQQSSDPWRDSFAVQTGGLMRQTSGHTISIGGRGVGGRGVTEICAMVPPMTVATTRIAARNDFIVE
ncbi:hypothetical protein BDZ97DRAFT_983301 [Flammula alnicola]|nr:hypothetical protein BDZ97DRAFT_983301 [Flammula alnicola]